MRAHHMAACTVVLAHCLTWQQPCHICTGLVSCLPALQDALSWNLWVAIVVTALVVGIVGEDLCTAMRLTIMRHHGRSRGAMPRLPQL